jgi:hypothetical protein
MWHAGKRRIRNDSKQPVQKVLMSVEMMNFPEVS